MTVRRGLIIAAAAPVLLLAACSRGEAPAAGGSEKIECALGADAKFEPVCGLERAERGAEKLYIVHHPDGGFRSFTVLGGGAGLAVADGAQAATQTVAGNLLEVTVGQDRYRFPVTAKK